MESLNPVSINPSLLSWAREESGYAMENIARRINVKREKVAAWERGDLTPTFRQLDILAKYLHRPLSVFFLPQPPEIPPLSAEYRRLPGIIPGHESPELRLALRQMLTRRENMLNLLGELDHPIQKFTMQTRLSEKPEDVGIRLREVLGISAKTQLGWNDSYQAWNGWRASVESLGVLVFQFSKVDLVEARGLTLLRSPLPVAAVNAKEIPESRIYTLIHEVVHLMLAFGREEKPALQETRTEAEWHKVERFAESTTSHVLFPKTVLREVVLNVRLGAKHFGIDDVRTIARKFKLTPLATATRLYESGYMNREQYERWVKVWNKYVATLPKRADGFATPVQMTIGRAGRPFVQVVLEAFHANRITTVDASRYLNLKYEHFGKLQETLIKGMFEAQIHE